MIGRDAVHLGDCLERLRALGPGFAAMAYMDPPFNTGQRRRATASHYDDGFGAMEEYLSFMQPRVKAAAEALAPDGVLLLHCDWRTSHHFRIMLDDLLGPQRFINHLIWCYGLGGSSPRRFARKHDDILFYAKSDAYYFHPPMIPATSQRLRGRMKKAIDVLNIPAINNMAAERTGYPTQKPLALLRLLVGACCPPNGVVLDPFCGSGTTLVAAQKLGRRFVGIDSNPDAVAIARSRLQSAPDQVMSAEAP